MSEILIKNGRVLNPADKTDKIADVYIKDGKIVEISSGIDRECKRVIDASGLIVAPGLVDIHAHLREPGYEYKEDIESGTRSAAAGGFTSIVCMPNTNPTADSPEILDYIRLRAENVGAVNVFPIASVSYGLKGEEMTDFASLKEHGAVAFSDDGRPVFDSAMMKKALERAKELSSIVISHCEELSVAGDNTVNDGEMAKKLGFDGISRASEEIMLARDAVLSDTTDARVHIAHISTKGSVELVRDAKARGVKITCETCPHYFALNESATDGYNTFAKMNPPLREEQDRLAIIQGLIDGTIDAIGTDHAPHSDEEKAREFKSAPNGILGFETALPMAIEFLRDKMSLMDILAVMSYNPSKILGIDKGEIKPGADADIVIFDADKKWVYKREDIVSKSNNSPFIDRELTGKVLFTIVGGEEVVSNGKVIV